MKHILATMELDPITLVDCVVAPIGRVANVKLKQEAAVQRARWVNGDRIVEGNPSKTPFSCIIGTNTVGDENKRSVLLIMAAVSRWIAGMDGMG